MKNTSLENNIRSKFAKRALGGILAAASCLSLMVAPVSAKKTSPFAVSSVEASAETSYKYICVEQPWVGVEAFISMGSYELKPGKWYTSPNKHYTLVFQHDGNLVIYIRYNDKLVYPIWSSRSNGLGGKHCVMQRNGNLVIYKADCKTPVWTTNTSTNNEITSLILTDTGELRIVSAKRNDPREYTHFTSAHSHGVLLAKR